MAESLYENYASTQSLRHQSIESQMRNGIRNYHSLYGSALKKHFQGRDWSSLKAFDIGCGTGVFLGYLRGQGVKDLSGVDLSTEQIRIARSAGFGGTQVQDARKFLKRSKTSYDLITAFDVLEHLELDYLLDLLGLIRSRLSPGGIFIAQIPNALCPLNPVRYADITHVRSFTANSLRQALLLSGFSRETPRFFSLPLPVTGIKSLVRRLVWDFFVHPPTKLYLFIQMGNVPDLITTGNLALAVVKTQ